MKAQLNGTYAEIMQSSSSAIYSFLENQVMKIHLRLKAILVLTFLCSIMLTIGEASAGVKGVGQVKVTQSWIDVNGTSQTIDPTQFVGGVITCTPEGPTNAQIGLALLSGMMVIAGGSWCSVTAVPPPQIFVPNTLAHYPACNGGKAYWITSYAPQQAAIMINAISTIAVTHTLKCDTTAPRSLSAPLNR